MNALENRMQRNYESSEGVALFVTEYFTKDFSYDLRRARYYKFIDLNDPQYQRTFTLYSQMGRVL